MKNHNTPVKGLYHIGASTHPGPGLGRFRVLGGKGTVEIAFKRILSEVWNHPLISSLYPISKEIRPAVFTNCGP